MAITIDYLTQIISIPQADLTFVSGTLYELDVNVFRKALNDIADSEEGITELTTHQHNTEVTVAGTTFARTVEIINGYSVEFEDGQYSVRLIGANNNVFDVENGILVQNQVQLISNNSAGLIVGAGSGLDAGEAARLILIEKILRNKFITDPSTGIATLYDNDGTTPLLTGNLFEDSNATTPYRSKGAERRERLT